MKFKIEKYEVEELYTPNLTDRAVELIEDEKIKKQLLTILTNRDKNMIRYMVSQNGELVAEITFSGESVTEPEIGIEISERYRYQGIGLMLLTKLMKRVEEIRKINYFIYKVRNDNAASIRLAEKLGGKLVRRYKPLPQFDLEFITYQIAS